MPAFDFSPADSVAGFQVFPKGDGYETELGEPKAFHRNGKDGKEDNYGVMFVSKIAEGEFKGKKRVVNCYMHTEDSRNYSKQVQMAALGYDPKKDGDEEKFNELTKSWDWKANPDDGSCGDGWHKMKGQIIVDDLDVQIDKDNNKLQKSKNIRPLKSATD